MGSRSILVAALISVGASSVFPGASAAASTRPAVATSDQAGYAATGAHFEFAGTYVKLPDAARFARNLGRLSVSVELWTSAMVIDLTATACTDVSCRPGGRPETRKYRLQLAVYDRTTGALICSTLAVGPQRCPDVPRSWNRARLAPGRVLDFALNYEIPYDFVYAYANNSLYTYPTRANLVFHQSRVGVEFGAGPLGQPHLRAPRRRTPIATFGIPPGPPFAAEIATRHASWCFVDPHWAYRRVHMTGSAAARRANPAPGRLSYFGCDFTVYLQR